MRDGFNYERVILKLGGGLITDKNVLCKPRIEQIKHLGKVVFSLQQMGICVVVVHGAGSFGHLIARKFRLQDGLLPNHDFDSVDSTISNQYEARDQVRKDMRSLNQIIVDEWARLGLAVETFPAHEIFTETGPNFKGGIKFFQRKSVEPIPMTYGDVVNCQGEKQFGILSGDDIIVRLGKELEKVSRVIFAVSGVDGILRKPPDVAVEDDLIEEFDPNTTSYTAEHNAKIDVTGGIGYKAASGYLIAQSGVIVLLVRGEISSRVLAACKGEPVRGTRITVTNK